MLLHYRPIDLYSYYISVQLNNSSHRMIQYMLLFSRQGKLRLQKWYNPITQKEKRRTTRELITMILARKPKMCSFLEYRDQKVQLDIN